MTMFSRENIRRTFPVFLGYITVGMIFGVLVHDIGQGAIFAFVAGLLIYGGAAQFLLIDLIKNSVPPFQVFIAIFLLNLRHVFYYAPVQSRIPDRGFPWMYSVFGLTDETFALLTSGIFNKKDGLAITQINHVYWVVGCTSGALLGMILKTKIEGLDFALTALFTVLCIEKIRAARDLLTLLLPLSLAVLCRFLLSAEFFLIAVLTLSRPLSYFLSRGERV